MAEWKLNFKERKATDETGREIYFDFSDGEWHASSEFATPHEARAVLQKFTEAIRIGGETLEARARAVYGGSWMDKLSADIGIPVRTIQQFRRGKMAFTMEHPAWADIDAALAKREPIEDALRDILHRIHQCRTEIDEPPFADDLISRLADRGLKIVWA